MLHFLLHACILLVLLLVSLLLLVPLLLLLPPLLPAQQAYGRQQLDQLRCAKAVQDWQAARPKPAYKIRWNRGKEVGSRQRRVGASRLQN